MSGLLDGGLKKLTTILLRMGDVAEKTVRTAMQTSRIVRDLSYARE